MNTLDEMEFPSEHHREFVKAQVAEANAFGAERRRHFQTGKLLTSRDYWDEQRVRGILNHAEWEAGLPFIV